MAFQPFSTPGAYGTPIPWHMRRDAPLYRPFAAFANCKPTPPPSPYTLGPIPPEELKRRRDEAEWLAFQHWVATTPGAPLPPRFPAAAPSRGLVGMLGELGVIRGLGEGKEKLETAWREAVARGRRLREGARELGRDVRDRCARAAFYCERRYWLAQYAYRQSGWPEVVSLVLYMAMLILALGLAMCLARMWAEEECGELKVPDSYYVLVPNYRSWSVSKPRQSV
ncbi:uncharacterized protein GGS25DRAFT_483180 [Hypoxylon fragiforme]|uniref:uncharacterized protein n=1 Tax=Hypoxylon fragiforme TaxID=63214 RepID=UPI0020C6CF9D|nr:uncharacterized protein GGS25DRAFT_483180 [Hypoxylon fragiforme]KAI2611544.1 hypothetical protein GGS25DRAFT_483180 [Hypoxylon fragiforme]